ncbi:6-phosphogluconolactonase [compost metagenome]
MSNAQKLLVFAGSYAESQGSGVYVYAFDEKTGALELLDEQSGLSNPTFVHVDVDQRKLYSISDRVTEEGGKAGEAVSFDIDPSTGKLTLLNRVNTVAGTTCHIQQHDTLPYLTVTSYHGGMIGLLSIREKGEIGELLDVAQHEGHGHHPERQDRPHPHSSFYSPDRRFLFVQDLGLDVIRSYKVEGDKLVLHGETKTHPGSGPRHLAFHPNGKYAFVINEVDSSVTTFAYDAEKGQLTEVGNISTLPAGFEGENTTAEIAVSEDGKYVYGSNRGHDSIVVYAFDSESGKLEVVEYVSVEGGHPRHFAIVPGGEFLLAANRDTNNIVTFKVDRATGRLQYTGLSVEVSKPVCVKPVYFSI